MTFDWIPFFREISDKLLQYKADRGALLALVQRIFEKAEVPLPKLDSEPLPPDFDPFSFYGLFCKNMKAENMQNLMRFFAEEMHIEAQVPDDLIIPMLNPLNATYYHFRNDPDYDPNEVDKLWDLFENAILYADQGSAYEEQFIAAFDAACGIKGNRWKQTMGLFWIRPEVFSDLDSRSRWYIKQHTELPESIRAEVEQMGDSLPNGKEYMNFCHHLMEYLQQNEKEKSIAEFSRNAYMESEIDNLIDELSGKPDEYTPPVLEYDPEIPTEKWLSVLAKLKNDKDLLTLKTLKALMMLGGEASIRQLYDAVGIKGSYSNISGAIATLGTLAIKQLKVTPWAGAKPKGNEKWNTIPCQYKYAGNRKNIRWKLRDNLLNALKKFEMSDIVVKVEVEPTVVTYDKNMILYGPPGTGKTYHTVIYAVAIIEGREKDEVAAEPYEEVLKRYNDYKKAGQVQFTTFHQSYGYEDFIEGIRPNIFNNEGNTELQYEYHNGIFKEFCKEADTPIIETSEISEPLIGASAVWKVSLGGTYENEIRRDCLENGYIRIGWDDYGEDLEQVADYAQGGKVVLNAFYNRMQIGDIVLSCFTNRIIDAIGIVTGECEWASQFPEMKRLRRVKWLVKNLQKDIVQLNGGKTMTLSTVYKLNVSVADVMAILQEAGQNDSVMKPNDKRYVFIIDEINRGNISKIFGELITLIEDKKRKGGPEEMSVVLPCSNDPFSVPGNVYLLGTMNTADRSIALMDTALRRRFSFVEMMPKSDILRANGADRVGDIDVARILDVMNERITYLYDREHAIGHAFFMPLKEDATIGTLAGIFKNAVIPLLQEYFFDDYKKIRMVLGDDGKAPEHQFIREEKVLPEHLFKGNADELGDREMMKYTINDEAFGRAESYRQII